MLSGGSKENIQEKGVNKEMVKKTLKQEFQPCKKEF